MNPENEYYKWGLFYYNKEDKRIFVPKGIQWFAWTLNFANAYSYLEIAIILFVVGLLPFLFTKNQQKF